MSLVAFLPKRCSNDTFTQFRFAKLDSSQDIVDKLRLDSYTPKDADNIRSDNYLDRYIITGL